ncbi:MAG: SDR family NAD(P)-dependent oxidoreductase [Candidatus Competibacteraceae bacterium]
MDVIDDGQRSWTAAGPAEIAIIGMGVLLPGAHDLRAYWTNILNGVSSLSEIPPERWDWRLYYDADPKTPDRVYSRWGGFIGEVLFDPGRYGLPPVALKAIDPLQLLTLEVVRQTLNDAGVDLARLDRERVAVMLGATGGLGDFGLEYGVRAELPRIVGAPETEAWARLPEWTEDSFAGLLLNVTAGRVSNRFDFGGVNCAVDAACASSLAAVYQAVNELRLGKCDLALAGGVDVMQSPFMYLCFAKTQALSPRGCCQTFDEQADGTTISEGLAVVALKRLADAERDQDRIYAVIRGIGGSSDGRAKGLTAPRPEGQLRALRRAYAEAGYSPATVGYWEAHGTGTVAGDRAELETISTLLNEAAAVPASCTVGSVKTLIGHTKGAAGAAGLIKAALALHHRVLPPHVGVRQPLPLLRDPVNPLFLCPKTQPWIAHITHPRRAAVSAFGFGGANFHATLEEYHDQRFPPAALTEWPAELCVWRAADRAGLMAALRQIREALTAGAQPRLADLAFSLAQALPTEGQTLAIVAESLPQLAERLDAALAGLAAGDIPVAGVYFAPEPLQQREAGAKLAVLFSGQGSQYPGMLRELAVFLPDARAALDQADAVFASSATGRRIEPAQLSALIHPPWRFVEDEMKAAQTRLTRTEIAQPALGAVMAGLWAWLARLGLRPDMAAGHSYGEYVALHAAGALPFETLLQLSEARGRFIVEAAADGELGTMLAVAAERTVVQSALAGLPGITFANHNGPRQLVLSGRPTDLDVARQRLDAQGIAATPLTVAAAFHSPLVAPAKEQLAAFMAELDFQAPRFAVYSNATAEPYPTQAEAIRALLAEHLVAPVRFMEEIQAMYAAGARLFLEVGPKDVLTRLTRQILGSQPHLAVAVDAGSGGLTGLLHALAALLAQQTPLDIGQLFHSRRVAVLDLERLVETTRPAPPSPQTWRVSGGYARRLDELPTSGRLSPLTAATVNAIEPKSPVIKSSSSSAYSVSSVGVPMSPPIEPIPGLGSVPAPAPVAWAVDQALVGYQDTMRQFLRVQEQVMLAYFATSRDEPAPTFAPSMPTLLQPAAPPPMLAPAAPVQAMPLPTPATPPTPEPAPIPVAAPVAPMSGQAAVSQALDLKALLLKIVSERTGYPEDMVALDQDIEADLGIDSIKRVEILGLFRRSLPEAFAQGLRSEMEEVARLPTFQEILDFVQRWISRQIGVETNLVQENLRPFDRAEAGIHASASLPRHLLQAQPEPIPEGVAEPLPPGLYLLTADELGVADRLSQRLRQAGVQPLLLPDEVLRDEEHVHSWLGRRDSALAVRAVIHLLPLGRSPLTPGTPFSTWQERLEQEVTALFPLLRLSQPELSRRGQVLTASGMGGGFGRDYRLGDSGLSAGFPAAAGLVGLVNTLNLEWNPDGKADGFHARAVDLDPATQPEALAEALFQELTWPGGHREIGYPGGIRTAFHPVAAPLPISSAPLRQPDADWVILATGGARGITAEVLYELAPYRPTLVLVGRTSLAEEEPQALRGLETAAALREHFIRQMQGPSVRPITIERQIQAVLRAREMRANLTALAQAGARVEYRTADMSDEVDVTALLAELYERYGRIDAVVHGAGIIEDRLMRDKTADSVARVLAAKANSAFLLARHLRPETLRFLAFFTSVAGRWGNRGQADYATANEIVNRLAWILHRWWGERVKIAAINWGPWAATVQGTGMVTPEIERQFAARGVSLVAPAAGRQWFLHELLYGPLADVELIAGDGLDEATAVGGAQEAAAVSNDPLKISGHESLDPPPSLSWEKDIFYL